MENNNKALITILLLGFLFRLAFILSPNELLITIVPDDAFYYFQTGKHILQSGFSSFDGINYTNGYHPLWMLLILPFQLISNPWLSLRLILLLANIFSLISGWLFYKISKKIFNNSSTAMFSLILFFLNPIVIAQDLNGLETSLSSLIFMICLYFVLQTFKNKYSLFNYGVILGLLFLSRTDNIFYILGFLAILTWQYKFASVYSFLSFGLVSSIWIILNMEHGFVQSSGMAVPLVLKDEFLSQGKNQFLLFRRSVKLFIDFFLFRMYQFIGINRMVFWFLGILSLFKIMSKKIYLNKQWQKIFILILFSLGLIVAHVSYRWYPRHWYFCQFIALICLVFGWSFKRVKKGNYRIFTLVFVVIFNLTLAIKFLINGVYPAQLEILRSTEWIRENIQEERVGVFNSGIISYFSGRTIVNLDGAINTNAYHALKKKDLTGYIKEQELDYIIDYQPVMGEMYRLYLTGLDYQLVEIIDISEIDWHNSKIEVWRL